MARAARIYRYGTAGLVSSRSNGVAAMKDIATENFRLREALAALLAIERPSFSADEKKAREEAREILRDTQ